MSFSKERFFRQEKQCDEHSRWLLIKKDYQGGSLACFIHEEAIALICATKKKFLKQEMLKMKCWRDFQPQQEDISNRNFSAYLIQGLVKRKPLLIQMQKITFPEEDIICASGLISANQISLSKKIGTPIIS